MAFDGSADSREDRVVPVKKRATKPNRPTKGPTAARRTATAPRQTGAEPEELALWRQILAYRDVLQKSASNWVEFLARERHGHDLWLKELPDEMHAARRDVWKHSAAEKNTPIALGRVQKFNERLSKFKNLDGDYTIVQLRRAAELFSRDLLAEALKAVSAYVLDGSELSRAYAIAALVAARDSAPRALDFTAGVERVLRPEDFAPDQRLDAEPNLAKLVDEARTFRKVKDAGAPVVARHVVATVLGMPPNSRKLRPL